MNNSVQDLTALIHTESETSVKARKTKKVATKEEPSSGLSALEKYKQEKKRFSRSVRISFITSPYLSDLLKERMEKEGVSMNELFNRALINYLEK